MAVSKAIPPPPDPVGWVLEPYPETSTRSASADGAAQSYIERVKAYDHAQDAVLEGRANTIWDAPGVNSDAPSAAKLSLLNAALIEERQAEQQLGVPRSASAIEMTDSVVQAMPDGTVRVTSKVKRTWTVPTRAAAAFGRTSATATEGMIDPIESTISIFVFDRCGDITIIEAAMPRYSDSGDHADPCSGFVNPDGAVEEVCGVSAGGSAGGKCEWFTPPTGCWATEKPGYKVSRDFMASEYSPTGRNVKVGA
ncbi:hypothetical protein GCM10022419_037100 [Nonomuraea rosea]|uniref:Uncharacterized protein n=1 Tax=Nonomuraea rosea TaxID=638574 RepID=A0ABP6WMZ2_9ACTN